MSLPSPDRRLNDAVHERFPLIEAWLSVPGWSLMTGTGGWLGNVSARQGTHHVRKSWQWPEMARAAAREAESKLLLGYVLGQQSVVLAEAGEVGAAVSVAAEAGSLVRGAAPYALRGWVAMTEADALAAAKDGAGARAKLAIASRLISGAPSDELPYLMLSPEHLARWRGHCLTLLGDSAALSDSSKPFQVRRIRSARRPASTPT